MDFELGWDIYEKPLKCCRLIHDCCRSIPSKKTPSADEDSAMRLKALQKASRRVLSWDCLLNSKAAACLLSLVSWKVSKRKWKSISVKKTWLKEAKKDISIHFFMYWVAVLVSHSVPRPVYCREPEAGLLPTAQPLALLMLPSLYAGLTEWTTPPREEKNRQKTGGVMPLV